MRLIALLIITCLPGCATYVGIGAHNLGSDAPEVTLDNPLAIVGTYSDYGQWETFCEHHSGIFTREAGAGYNLCGVRYYFDESRETEVKTW